MCGAVEAELEQCRRELAECKEQQARTRPFMGLVGDSSWCMAVWLLDLICLFALVSSMRKSPPMLQGP